ncbi:hypothetical protein [Sulfolobus sp. S-194]|nr:hypothetical protein [Sulfolobus sp. S-194]
MFIVEGPQSFSVIVVISHVISITRRVFFSVHVNDIIGMRS